MSEQLEKLKKRVAGLKGIRGFFEDYRFLSNFHLRNVVFENIMFSSVENAFQAAKTLDLTERKEFLPLKPNEAKWKGRKVKIRADWEEIKDSIMEDLVRQKFSQGELKDKLLATGDEYLEETNWWDDRYWGFCMGDCKRGPHKPEGLNKLGHILMKIRKELHGREATETQEQVS